MPLQLNAMMDVRFDMSFVFFQRRVSRLVIPIGQLKTFLEGWQVGPISMHLSRTSGVVTV